ncbi:unnamed protein product [Ectocarpus sp. 6 AP-2014]
MTAPYAIQLPVPGNAVVDCARVRGIASLANGIFKPDGTVAPLIRHNCKVSYRPVGDGIPGLWLKTTKTIEKGAEIFMSYGEGGYSLEDSHSTELQ